ncbi:tryptophan 7-halogenase [Sphingomonas sp. R647]|uniref:tryptophan halogenase family protein n=1 Tax=Sphingomonas sp. R647 TaxID=2875233 RepID=UPI001CD791A6|nr:tryptophan halogenase family protein [Sphingomonas sp. R647]MCA1199798.1 tryptophan 7-halogenase [Sphingomonas sp. R647]
MIDPVRVVIVGGGTAGWMAASALARFLPGVADVRLIESEEIGIVGVGEATLPHLRAFLQRLGIDEAEMMRATNATYKLGIDFRDFGKLGDRYVHPFGAYGVDLAGVGFHHYWLRARDEGSRRSLEDYSLPIVAARANRFALPPADGDFLSTSYGWAYQFDATKLAPMLRGYSQARGVTRTEGRVTGVERDGESGDVTELMLESGERVAGDLFIDCSGFRALLIGGAMDAAWEDWSHWLPCDRAAALPATRVDGPIEPYTRATAMTAGWRWRIPLQHRVGNGYVFSSSFLSEDAACDAILGAVEGTPLADPRILRFRAGRRRESWVGNVVSIGLASGFLEPLESTSIHLAQMAVMRLIELFPERQIDPADRAAFNATVDYEYDRVRDFLILHYHATTRDDSDFWNHVRTMDLPDSLAGKLELWREAGRIEQHGEGLFLEPSWVAVYLGQGMIPARHDPRADNPSPAALTRALDDMARTIRERVDAMPDHEAALRAQGAWGAA